MTRAYDLSIPIRFGAESVNAFGLPDAAATPFTSGDFVADTKLGAAVNCQIVTLAPHGNGTHTESVSHIVDELVPVCDVVPLSSVACVVKSVNVTRLGDCDQTYPEGDIDDWVIPSFDVPNGLEALVVRTLPNSETKRTERHSNPPYLTTEAMAQIAASSIRHLLVDVPSVDRESDDGNLRNHRTYWQVSLGSKHLTDQTRKDRTITEMIFVPDVVTDGRYRLTISVPRIETDAMLSRVVLHDDAPTES